MKPTLSNTTIIIVNPDSVVEAQVRSIVIHSKKYSCKIEFIVEVSGDTEWIHIIRKKLS